MRKPLHWEDIEDENLAILSAVGTLRVNLAFICQSEYGMDEEEINSALWGYWVENSKELRPQVYRLWKSLNKFFDRILKKIKNTQNDK